MTPFQEWWLRWRVAITLTLFAVASIVLWLVLSPR